MPSNENVEQATKFCSLCKQCLPINVFGKHSGHKDGLASSCKHCLRIKDKEKYQKHREKILKQFAIRYKENVEENRKQRRAHYNRNKQPYLERSRRQREQNKELIAAYKRQWSQKNRHKKNAAEGKRRAIQLSACPSWLTQDDVALIDSTYAVARWLTLTCFQKYHVDHIVPLQGSSVCGLHVPWNLQVLSATENMSKGNKLETLQ